MTKKQAIASLQSAQQKMAVDPDLEDVDTLSLMEDAIYDALEFLTGVRPAQECPDCADGQSTYCGSMCESCLEAHCKECEVCAADFA